MRHVGKVAVGVALALVGASVLAQPVSPPTPKHRGPVVTAAVDRSASPGRQVFQRWCSSCHAPGERFPGTASLAAKYGKDMPAALEQRTDLTPDVIAYFVRHGVLIMPPFRKSEITDGELRDLGLYLSKTEKKK